MEKQNYIGRKVKGFSFESTNKCRYSEDMDEYIGKIGEISSYNEFNDVFRVSFIREYWFYPASLIDQHLVPEEQEETELRDQFAMQALNALCVSMQDQPVITLAIVCYNIADAMLKARKEVKGE